MSDHRSRFLQLALHSQALRFGEFTLKSGRLSPYFFNAGRFDSGAKLADLAACYADAVEAAGVQFDLLFGPAYKGIPLATALGCEFARRGRDLPVAFNRKEAKAHGEGGMLIGAPLEDRQVLIVDDVITAGTAIREALGDDPGRRRPCGRDRGGAGSPGSAGRGRRGRHGAAFGRAIGGGGNGGARDCGRKPARPACFRRRKR